MMQSDDKNDETPDDDPLFSEDDFDSIGDFDDEDWEDDDDLSDEMLVDDLPNENLEEDVGPDPFTSFEDFEDEEEEDNYVFETGQSGQKTFIQKYFNIIVILVVVIFAGLWFLAQGGGGQNNQLPSSNSNETTATNIADASQSPTEESGSIDTLPEDLPPQPAPFQTDVLPELAPTPITPKTAEETQAADVEPTPDSTFNTEEAALTPLPGAAGNTAAPKLADLDKFLKESGDTRKPAPVIDIDEEELISGDTASTKAVVQAEITPPADNTDSAQSVENQLTSLEVAPDTQEAPIENTVEETGIVQEPLQDEVLQIAAETQASEALTQENVTLKKEVEQSREALDSLQQELKAVQMRLETSQKELEIAQKTVQEQTLIEKIGDVTETVEPKVMAKKIIIEDPAPKPVKTIKKAEKPRKAVTKKTPRKARIKWVLRAASPGRATLAEQGSNDLISVEVGSNVKGLGRIKSIGTENGKWVVRGTNGSVSR